MKFRLKSSLLPEGVWVPSAVIAVATPRQLSLYCTLVVACAQRDVCEPTQAWLADRIGCCVTTVAKDLRALREADLIEVFARFQEVPGYRRRSRRANAYRPRVFATPGEGSSRSSAR
jgi:hypothetical protein